MRKQTALFIVALFVIRCAGPGSGSTEASSLPGAPNWFLNPPTEEGALYGVGNAKKQNPSLAKNAAAARARTEVANAVEVKVSSMLKDFMQESGVGESAEALEFTQQVTKQVTDQTLQGCVIKSTSVGKDGMVYVLVEYPLTAMRDSALNEARRQEALYNEFKAEQGFQALEKAIEQMK